MAAWTSAAVFDRPLPRLRLRPVVYVGYVVAFVVFDAVVRNVPGFEWFHLSYMQAGIGR